MTAPSPTRISSSEIQARFERLQWQQDLFFRPGPLLVYKPQADVARGVAMKLEYRAAPYFTDQGYLRRPVRTEGEDPGGMFLVLAAQTGVENDNAQFNWNPKVVTNPAQVPTTTKLGMPDIEKLLLAHRYIRDRDKLLPEQFRARRKDQASGQWVPETTGFVLGLTHKSKTGTTIIEWQFAAKGSYLQVSKLPTGGKLERRSCSMSLAEELSFVAYITMAQQAFFQAGLR